MQDLRDILQKYWGYDGFLPLQQEAMTSVLQNRDSVVILPTGGGKSLCFQAPAMLMEGLAVVVSPLISLMKDQVDALTACGVPAAYINSSQTAAERREVLSQLDSGEIKLLYVSPERLAGGGFVESLVHSKVSFVAVDEAHCISMWGHDFRPEYRQLQTLKDSFPGIAVHAYTATATEHVRNDIVEAMQLEDPDVLVGSFDRPNLIYHIRRRNDLFDQVREVIDRHRSDSGIIYCIRRTDVEELAARLNANGYNAQPYHAGMSDQDRKNNQEAFITEKIDTIVATVAFGMGIDKSNVRYVIHAAMPKSLEHYQQETGRAGRDGLEADCCLFYGGNDFSVWSRILSDSEPQTAEIALQKLNDMYNFSSGVSCRHRAIVSYFGQELDKDSCDACDVCLGDVTGISDSLVISQKIISCVYRLEQRFGGDYTAMVLVGSKDERIIANGHDQLSTYALLAEFTKRIVRDWVEQLVDQRCLVKVGEYNVLNVTKKGMQVIRAELTPYLLEPLHKKKTTKKAKVSKVEKDSWEGVNEGLFEHLRTLRRDIAEDRGVPAYVVFGDAALRDMARRRPTTEGSFLLVKGVGEKKAKVFGEQFVDAITEYSIDNNLNTDCL